MRYIGKKEIQKIDEKNNIVFFTDNTKEIFSKEVLKYIITEKPIDLTKLRELKCNPIIKDVINILLNFQSYIIDEGDDRDILYQNTIAEIIKLIEKYNVYTSEVEYICKQAQGILLSNMAVTINCMAYYKDRKEYLDKFLDTDINDKKNIVNIINDIFKKGDYKELEGKGEYKMIYNEIQHNCIYIFNIIINYFEVDKNNAIEKALGYKKEIIPISHINKILKS